MYNIYIGYYYSYWQEIVNKSRYKKREIQDRYNQKNPQPKIEKPSLTWKWN